MWEQRETVTSKNSGTGKNSFYTQNSRMNRLNKTRTTFIIIVLILKIGKTGNKIGTEKRSEKAFH